ncbi:PIN domain nuclease [Sphingosinicella sp. YJ22]|uniref:type II toxin-antitoxin system VapC family toxin n=1 Tax=Sphingosinicella sp. YJ22 TaxID=1104780 RepID=UPI00140984F8|nr:PIN domain nuclease [Sphingosinicella sp. YJ22]
MIFVDSSVWIDYFRGSATPETDRLDALLGQQELIVGDLVLTEVLQGFDAEQDFRTALGLFDTLTMVEIGGRDIALEAARNFRRLRAKAVTVRKTIDTLIATWCIEHRVPLLYSDRDFDPFTRHLGLETAI